MDAQELEKKTLKIIQRNIKKRRSELDMTQFQLAEKIGIIRQNIQLIETRGKGLTLATLSKLSIALDISIINLMTEENED